MHRSLNKLLFAGVLTVVAPLYAQSAPKTAKAPAGQSAEQITSSVQKLYDATKDFTAAFEQEYEMRALGRSTKSTGRVAYRKPGQIRFDYASPQTKTFAVDGTTLWVFQPSDKQALVDRCFRADGLTAPLVFLGGSGRIAEQFDVKLEEGDPATYGLRLVPRQPQGAFRSILLKVDRKSYEVRSSEVEDQSGNPNRFTFTNVRRNKGVKDADVKFVPPADISVSPVPGSCLQPAPPPAQVAPAPPTKPRSAPR